MTWLKVVLLGIGSETQPTPPPPQLYYMYSENNKNLDLFILINAFSVKNFFFFNFAQAYNLFIKIK